MRTAPTRARDASVGRAGGLVLVVLLTTCLVATSASAYWGATGYAAVHLVTSHLAPPTGTAVPASVTADVPVGWTAGVSGVPADGFYVTRVTAGTSSPACGSSPEVLVPGSSCTDVGAPPGEHAYVVTAVFRSWTAAGVPSGAVTVSGTLPLLGAAADYSVLAGTAVVGTGATSVSGDLGVSPGLTVSGFPPGIVGGDLHVGDADAAGARAALVAAYDQLAALEPDAAVSGDLAGVTLAPGVYEGTAALTLTGTLTLDAGGDPDAVFVLQARAALSTAAGSTVGLVGGAQASHVFWVVAGAAGTGADSSFSGTVLAQGAITTGARAVLIGRALSLDAVTLDSSTVRFTTAPPPTIDIDGGDATATKDTTPSIGGTSDAPAGSVVTVTVAGQSLVTATAGDGSWVVVAAGLVAGTHPVVAQVRVASGDGGADSQQLTVEVNPAPVLLGTAATYSVLAATGIVSTGATVLGGDLGVSPSTAVSGFPPGVVLGSTRIGDAAATTAQADLVAALADASSRTPHTEIAGDLGGRTFHVGVHHVTAALALTGTVVLDAEGDPGAVFVFQTDAALNTAAGSSVVLAGGAQASNVFWVVAGAAGTGADSSFAGVILARGAITLGAGSDLVGQALSRGTVTLAGNDVSGAGSP